MNGSSASDDGLGKGGLGKGVVVGGERSAKLTERRNRATLCLIIWCVPLVVNDTVHRVAARKANASRVGCRSIYGRVLVQAKFKAARGVDQ